jgi:hypothetical protein
MSEWEPPRAVATRKKYEASRRSAHLLAGLKSLINDEGGTSVAGPYTLLPVRLQSVLLDDTSTTPTRKS